MSMWIVRTQVKCAGGRTDMVVWMPDVLYVFELKVNATAHEALQQIDNKGYAIPYHTDERRVVKVGVSMNINTRTVDEWEIAEQGRWECMNMQFPFRFLGQTNFAK